MEVKEVLKNKRFIYTSGICILLIVLIIISAFLYKKESLVPSNEKEKKIYANTSADLIKDTTYEGLEFTNIALITDKEYSTFTASVTNKKEEVINIENVNIILKDKKGNNVVTLLGNIGENLKPGETRTITASTKSELKGVVSKEINQKK